MHFDARVLGTTLRILEAPLCTYVGDMHWVIDDAVAAITARASQTPDETLAAMMELMGSLGENCDHEFVDALFAVKSPDHTGPMAQRISFAGRDDVLFISAYSSVWNIPSEQVMWGDGRDAAAGCNLVLWPFWPSERDHASLLVIDLAPADGRPLPAVLIIDTIAPIAIPSGQQLIAMLQFLAAANMPNLCPALIPFIASRRMPLVLSAADMLPPTATLWLPVLAAFYITKGARVVRALGTRLPPDAQFQPCVEDLLGAIAQYVNCLSERAVQHFNCFVDETPAFL